MLINDSKTFIFLLQSTETATFSPLHTPGSDDVTTSAITYLKATGVLMGEFRSRMIHFLITLNNIYLPSNVLSPTPRAH